MYKIDMAPKKIHRRENTLAIGENEVVFKTAAKTVKWGVAEGMIINWGVQEMEEISQIVYSWSLDSEGEL